MATDVSRSVPPENTAANAATAARPLGGGEQVKWAILMVAAALLLAMLIVDPFREFMPQDDGWAYARSVERLLDTGRYQLDAWSAANMPVQIYLAGLLAKVFGYSLSILRISTLLLLVAGLAAFFALLRSGTSAWTSALLTLGLLASPLVVMLSFTFMSDIQYMAWMLIALWLYARGFERDDIGTLFLASLAAACAIGTRQFGIALLGGMVLAWLLIDGRRRAPAVRLIIAATLPTAVALWQLRAGVSEPNFTQAVRLHEQAYFLSQPPILMLKEFGWRLSTILQYLGLSMLPIFPLLAKTLVDRGSTSITLRNPHLRGGGWRAEKLAVAIFSVLLVFSLWTSPISTRDNAGHVLPLWWMLPNAFGTHAIVMKGLALAGLVGTFALLLLLCRQARLHRRLRDLSWAALLMGSTFVCLLALHLSYVQLNDTYIVGLLPFALFFVSRALGRHALERRWSTASAALSFVMLVLLSLWMRADYNRQQAQWNAADRLTSQGIDRQCIGASRHWSEYHGAYDDWLAEVHSNFDHRRGDRSPAPPGSLHEPFYAWMELRSSKGTYRISTEHNEAPAGWHVIAETPYVNSRFAEQRVITLQRDLPEQTASVLCKR